MTDPQFAEMQACVDLLTDATEAFITDDNSLASDKIAEACSRYDGKPLFVAALTFAYTYPLVKAWAAGGGTPVAAFAVDGNGRPLSDVDIKPEMRFAVAFMNMAIRRDYKGARELWYACENVPLGIAQLVLLMARQAKKLQV